MHKNWLSEPLGTEPSIGGISLIEIDESKIICNSNKIYYMFYMVERANKYTSVFYVFDYRQKETLLLIIIKNIFTVNIIKVHRYRSKEEIHNKCFSTRVYSDCWGCIKY